MAKVSRDRTSWKAGGVLRRDAQHTHDGPDRKAPGKRKDTRRWCGGKPGREHRPECMAMPWSLAPDGKHPEARQLVCVTCGRVLDTWWAFRVRGRASSFDAEGRETVDVWVTPRPPWVTF